MKEIDYQKFNNRYCERVNKYISICKLPYLETEEGEKKTNGPTFA